MTPDYPYWTRTLRPEAGSVEFELRADQASALHQEIRAILQAANGRDPVSYPRLEELAHRLSFDVDYLA
jgi:hypothetical protein